MDINIEAQERKVKGTSNSKRLRRMDDLIPGIIYGGTKEPSLISITDKNLRKASENESFYSQVITLKVNGSNEKVVLKELQRHPYRPFFVHADFQRIREDVKLTMNIPLHFLNAETCKGVKQQGGVVSYDISELDITCLPKDLPAFIEVDLEEMELSQILHISDLKLPEGVDSVVMLQDKDGDHDMPVVRVVEPRIAADEEAAEEAAAAAAESEAAEAAEDEEGEEGKEGEKGDKEEKEGKPAKDA